MRSLSLIFLLCMGLSVFAKEGDVPTPCEAGLIQAGDLYSSEDRLFEFTAKRGLFNPEVQTLLTRFIELSIQGVDSEESYHLFTAFLAGLPYADIEADPSFDARVMKQWMKQDRKSRKNWSNEVSRYRPRLMYKLQMAKLGKYLGL